MDVGQTVASNYSTPQLFLIAKDLSQMQILANVDESDIGAIKDGQPVRFSVQAYPNQQFRRPGQAGSTAVEDDRECRQLHGGGGRRRIKDGKLLPGMTATVEFLTGAAKNVLTAPNAALRFRPPQEALGKGHGKRVGSGAQRRRRSRGANRNQRGRGQRRPENIGTLWYLDAKGNLSLRSRTHRHHRRAEDRSCRAGVERRHAGDRRRHSGGAERGAGIFQPGGPQPAGSRRR